MIRRAIYSILFLGLISVPLQAQNKTAPLGDAPRHGQGGVPAFVFHAHA